MFWRLGKLKNGIKYYMEVLIMPCVFVYTPIYDLNGTFFERDLQKGCE